MEPAEAPLDQPLPAAAAPPTQSGAVAWKVILAVVAVTLWLGVAWQVVIHIPRAERIFAEFHMRVPVATELVIRFGQWAIPVLAVTSLLVCLIVRQRWAWLWLLIVLPAFTNGAVFLSLYVPYSRLIEGLGGAAHWWDGLLF
jgi:hypothetical protein